MIARYGFDLAAVISASHNPYEDNGIKFFGADGFKLSDETSSRSSASSSDGMGQRRTAIGRVRELRGTRRGLSARAAHAL